MKRLATAAVGVPLALVAVFAMPMTAFAAFIMAIVCWAAWEFTELLAPHAPAAPRWLVLIFLPPAMALSIWALTPIGAPSGETVVLVGGLYFAVGLAALLLAGFTPAAQLPAALGIVGFGVPYFAFPGACMVVLQQLDPWLVVLLFAVVWLNDAAAYYVGSAIGRHKMAPILSPNKSWEGALAGFLTGVAAAAGWCGLRLGTIDVPLVGVAAATAVAGQVGDLVESAFKRGVGAKDSGSVLPGHGGVFDRIDAMLLAVPVLLAGLWLIGYDGIAL